MQRIDGTAGDWARLREGLRVVECELNTRCNRSCSYCPQGAGLVHGDLFMAPSLLDRLLDDLRRIDFRGRFSHHLYGEPLLDPHLVERVRAIRSALPRAVQVLFTNGDLMTDAKHGELVEAGVDLTVVTRHQVGTYPERRHQVVQYAKDLLLTSRGGSIAWISKRRPLEASRSTACFAPSEMAVITFDGKVLRCYEDARRAGALGDISTHSLASIWAASESVRRSLARGARCEAGAPCVTCENVNHAVAGSSVATESFWATDADAASIARRALDGI